MVAARFLMEPLNKTNCGLAAAERMTLAGVRVGGSPFFPTSFRWGYGWPYPRFYGDLSFDERRQIEARKSSEQVE